MARTTLILKHERQLKDLLDNKKFIELCLLVKQVLHLIKTFDNRVLNVKSNSDMYIDFISKELNRQRNRLQKKSQQIEEPVKLQKRGRRTKKRVQQPRKKRRRRAKKRN